MNKRNNGFTLIELLAVIVVLSIILVIATSSVLKYIEESKEKTKYIAAKEIVEIAEAYFATKPISDDDGQDSISAEEMVKGGYLEKDVTNPLTGESRSDSKNLAGQSVCKDDGYLASLQEGYSNNNGKGYYFDGYFYSLNGKCS